MYWYIRTIIFGVYVCVYTLTDQHHIQSYDSSVNKAEPTSRVTGAGGVLGGRAEKFPGAAVAARHRLLW